MILECRGIYQDVVDIDNYPAVKHVSEYIVNERLENGWTVGKPEGHNEIFVVPSRGGKGGLPLIPLPDADEIVGAA